MNEWTKWVDMSIITENTVWLIEGKAAEKKNQKEKTALKRERNWCRELKRIGCRL